MTDKIERRWTTKAGFEACCLWVGNSHRCGYVAVPKDHPLFGKDYGAHLDVLRPLWERIKNGAIGKRGIIPLFFALQDDTPPSADCVFDVHGSLTYSGGDGEHPVEGADLWWFGFDCAHHGDKTTYSGDGEERTLAYVEQECESLAAQLAQVQPQEVRV